MVAHASTAHEEKPLTTIVMSCFIWIVPTPFAGKTVRWPAKTFRHLRHLPVFWSLSSGLVGDGGKVVQSLKSTYHLGGGVPLTFAVLHVRTPQTTDARVLNLMTVTQGDCRL